MDDYYNMHEGFTQAEIEAEQAWLNDYTLENEILEEASANFINYSIDEAPGIGDS